MFNGTPTSFRSNLFWRIRWLLPLIFGLVLSACNTGFGRSGNADLDSLDVSDIEGNSLSLDPNFDDDETEYTLEVANRIDTLVFNAETEDDEASMSLNGTSLTNNVNLNVSLATGPNRIRLVVTAENEREKTYVVTVTRAATDSNIATLRSLEFENLVLDPAFDAQTTEYTAETNYLVRSTRIRAERSNNQARVTLTGNENLQFDDDVASAEVPIAEGQQVLTINVVAGDGVSAMDYGLAITRGEKSSLDVRTYIKAESPDDGDLFGSAVAIDGTTLAVGLPGRDGIGLSSGIVAIFENNGGVWSERERLEADDPSANEQFGSSLAIDGDYLAVGAPGNSNNTGAVYVFERSGNDWVFRRRITASSGNTSDEFGRSVSLFGDELLVGAPGRASERGAVYAYSRNGLDWEDEQLIEAVNGEASDNFGAVVMFNRSLSGRDENLEFAAGAPFEDGGDPDDDTIERQDAGAVYVFERDDDTETWSQSFYVKPDTIDAGDEFGSALVLDGDRLLVGAPGESNEVTSEFVDVDDNNQNIPDNGAAYVFDRPGGQDENWEQAAYLKPTQARAMRFGEALGLSAGMVAVGAPLESSNAIGFDSSNDEDDSEPEAGAVYLFSSGARWEYEGYVKASNTDEGDRFGSTVVLAGEDLFIAAVNEDGGNGGVDAPENNNRTDAGALYLLR